MIINYEQALTELEYLANKHGAELMAQNNKWSGGSGWVVIIVDIDYNEIYYKGNGDTMANAIFDCYYNSIERK